MTDIPLRRMKLYLDIDGVLLGHHDGKHGLAGGAGEFIQYVTEHFDCYWLTTHCKGDAAPVLKYLRPYVDDEIYTALRLIRPAGFRVFKTEALDPGDDFIWIEDKPLAAEIEWLETHAKRSSWWQVDAYNDADALNHCLQKLKMIRDSS
jgi:hypothetical protein